MHLKDTIPIAYHAGTYGTYLEWVLTTLTDQGDIVAPFKEQGNSHKFTGNFLYNINEWELYLEDTTYVKFLRLHPKTDKNQSLSNNLDFILSQGNKMIYLYPDNSTKLLAVNNMFTKIWKDWWSYHFTHKIINSEYIYNNWPVDPNTDIRDIPMWIRREFLSFYLMPAWHDQVEWYHPAHWQNPNCLIVSISELLHNFEYTLSTIQKFCNLTYQKSTAELVPTHNLMLSLQTNLDQDLICDQIIEHTLDKKNFDWKPLPLASESWIQWQLRNLGFEIRCHGLDIFPTNSIQLNNLLYSI